MSGFGSSPGGYSELQVTGITKIIGPKIKTQKNPWTKNNPPPPHPQKKKSHAKFLSLKNLQKGNLVWFYFNRRTGWDTWPCGHTGPPNKILDKFCYPKNSRNQKFQPKKTFNHPYHLKSRVPPWGQFISRSDMKQFLRILQESGPWLRKFYWHIKG